ncbi:uncharacterized protein [Phyllobates terribilis]|uniref:uncharacterized protein n=1 Tax=Phyllobates terribilis TaxID=111132 RepID=UPI003CCB3C07
MSVNYLNLRPTINNVLSPPSLLQRSSPSDQTVVYGATSPMLSSFQPFYSFIARKQLPLSSASPKFSMRIASGSKQAYICRDCGYIYSDRTPFEKQPDKYFCPVCGAPKRRFRPYEEPVSKNANSVDVRKARKEQIKKDESLGKALPYAIAIGILALAGLYFYLQSTYHIEEYMNKTVINNKLSILTQMKPNYTEDTINPT